MSPPLVVAFALAGRVDIDLSSEPLGTGKDGAAGLPDATSGRRLQEVRDAMQSRAASPRSSASSTRDFAAQNPKWNEIPSHRRQRLRVGPPVAPTSRSRRSSTTSRMQPGDIARDQRRAPARHLRRLASPPTTSRPPAPSRRPRPPASYLVENGVQLRGLQQLRLAPRQRPHHDPRHLRQRPHQEPDARRRGRRRHASAARRREDVASTTPPMKYQKRRHPADHHRRPGVRHRLSRATGPPRAPTCSA